MTHDTNDEDPGYNIHFESITQAATYANVEHHLSEEGWDAMERYLLNDLGRSRDEIVEHVPYVNCDFEEHALRNFFLRNRFLQLPWLMNEHLCEELKRRNFIAAHYRVRDEYRILVDIESNATLDKEELRKAYNTISPGCVPTYTGYIPCRTAGTQLPYSWNPEDDTTNSEAILEVTEKYEYNGLSVFLFKSRTNGKAWVDHNWMCIAIRHKDGELGISRSMAAGSSPGDVAAASKHAYKFFETFKHLITYRNQVYQDTCDFTEAILSEGHALMGAGSLDYCTCKDYVPYYCDYLQYIKEYAHRFDDTAWQERIRQYEEPVQEASEEEEE